MTVRSWFPARIGPRSAAKDTITEVTFYGWPATYVKFTDDEQKLHDVAVNPVRSQRVLRELRARGYPIVDRRPRPRRRRL